MLHLLLSLFYISAELFRHFYSVNLKLYPMANNWLGGLLGGLGSVVSAGIGAISQNNANKTNLKISQETNAANMQMNQANIDAAMAMYDRQEAYNREIYEDQKDYNSAVNQRKRLEEAGLNPYMMMSGGSAGTASSSTAPSYSQPNMIPMQAARVDPVITASDLDGIGNSINQGRLADAQVDKTRAEATSQWQDANYKETILKLSAAKMVSEMSNLDARTKSMLIDNFVKQNTIDYSIQSAKNDADYGYQQARSMALQVAAQNAQLPYVGPTAAAQLDNLVANKLLTDKQINLSDAQRDLIRAQIRTESQKPALISQQIALMVEQGKLSKAQASKAYADALYTNKQRLNMPNLTKAQCDMLGDLMVESATNAAIISGSEAEKQGSYLNASPDYKEFYNFINDAGKALSPFK